MYSRVESAVLIRICCLKVPLACLVMILIKRNIKINEQGVFSFNKSSPLLKAWKYHVMSSYASHAY